MLYKELAVLDKLIREGKQVDRGRRKEVSRDLARQQKEYERFINQVKLNNRELASLISVQTVDIGEIQGLLDPETTIVEYFTGSRQSYAWTITRDRVTVQPLDLTSKKAAALVNDYRGALLPGQVRRGLLDRGVAGVVPLTGMETSPYTKYRSATDDECRHITSRIGAKLYAKLVAPVAGQLQTRELIIIPHGPLHKLPFAALETNGSYLMEKYTLSTAPSPSVLSYITKKRNPNQGRLLAFANPKTMYPPLPGTETEVAHIRPLFAGGATVYKRAAATETRARLAAGSPDVLHFASHGEFNERQPMQSGLLLTGDDRNDGKLQVHELFGLDLKNVNLVTLSACSTALARIESGDDMVGLSRGFIYAGTPALLASLWEVEDAATATLMEEFYRNWLKKKMPRPLALQTAQRTLRNNPRTSAPYYWAAFELIGDWM